MLLALVLQCVLTSSHTLRTTRTVATTTAAAVITSHSLCSSLTTCLSCLENPACGFCSTIHPSSQHGDVLAGTCMRAQDTGASTQHCGGGWMVSPLTKNNIARVDEAQTCDALVSRTATRETKEELYVEGELLGLVSRACVPCRGFWPKCDCTSTPMPGNHAK